MNSPRPRTFSAHWRTSTTRVITRSSIGKVLSRTTSSSYARTRESPQRVPADLRHDPLVMAPRNTASTKRKLFGTSSSVTDNTEAATRSTGSIRASITWSILSRPPLATMVPRSASSSCTARSAAQKAPSSGCSRKASKNTRAPPMAHVHLRLDERRPVKSKRRCTRSRTDELVCPMREDPLHLIPIEQRSEFLAKLMQERTEPQLSGADRR